MDDLRLLMRANHIPCWQVAEVLGIHEVTLYRWLRLYDEEKHEQILSAINHLMDGKPKKDDLSLEQRVELLENELAELKANEKHYSE